jgi:hypothetical protein
MRYAALLLALCCAPLLAQEATWQPEKTWVFAVGVLAFENKSLATWPDEGRVDAVMIDAYKKRGVPEDHILFIKNKDATKSNITSKFAEHLAKAGAEDTFIFYYAGHGGRDFQDDARPVCLIPYDTSAKKNANWELSELFSAIDQNFKGAQVLLTADCCHSGQLAVDAAKHSAKISYGVLTSAHAGSRSTGNWTFTQCLVDMINGNALLDGNGDGKITFKEAASYCEEEMSFMEGQLSCSANTGRFKLDTVMATAGEKKPARVGERCEGLDQGKWWKVKILDAKDGKFFVTWLGWDKKFDAWVTEDKLRPFKPVVHEGGTVVEVEWDKKWYKAKVLQNKLGLHFVHYEGFPDVDNEWVPANRLRLPKGK